MRCRAPVEHLRERVRERDRVALDGDVDVEALLAEQDVADRAADEVDAVRRGRPGARPRRRSRAAAGSREAARRCSPPARRLRRRDSFELRRRSARLTTPTSSSSRRTATRPSSAAVTRARSSGSDESSLDRRDPAAHDPAHRRMREVVADRLVEVLAAHPADEPVPSTTKTPLWPCRWQSFIASRTLESGADCAGRRRHHVARERARRRALPATRPATRSRAVARLSREIADAAWAWPPPPKCLRDRSGVDRCERLRTTDEHALVHLDEEDERSRVGEVDDLVGEVRDAVDVLRPRASPASSTSSPPASTGSSSSSSASAARARRRRAARGGTR